METKKPNKPPRKKKAISTPNKLWQLFMDYVAHEAANPMHRIDYVGKNGTRKETPLETPITFEGFECYLQDQGVINDLGDYSKNKEGAYDAYSPIIARIRQNCFVHNFKGASVGIFNANIIAKKLGLIEKSQVEVKAEQPLFPD
jgi:hypothetical protein